MGGARYFFAFFKFYINIIGGSNYYFIFTGSKNLTLMGCDGLVRREVFVIHQKNSSAHIRNLHFELNYLYLAFTF